MQIKEAIFFENLLNTYITRGLRVTLVTLLRLVSTSLTYLVKSVNCLAFYLVKSSKSTCQFLTYIRFPILENRRMY